jgi:hypothetical protein
MNSTALTKIEVSSLAECEAVIQRGVETFLEVGNALLRIRDERLYRAEFANFHEYCLQRWQFTRRSADRLISAAAVTGQLRPIGLIPSSESVARPLTGLPPAQQREAWQAAVADSPGGQPTAKQVTAAVSKIVPIAGYGSGKEARVFYRSDNGHDCAVAAIQCLSEIDPRARDRETAFDEVNRWIEKNRPHKRKAVS